MLYDIAEDENPSMGEDGEMIETSKSREIIAKEGNLDVESCVGMIFESEEAAKVFYDSYATQLGSLCELMHFGNRCVAEMWHGEDLCVIKKVFANVDLNVAKVGSLEQSPGKGCKAMIVVKRGKTGKWVVTRFVKEHNHPLVVAPNNHRRTMILSQTPDDREVKIRELTAELNRERKKSAAIQEKLNMVLKDMEEHSNQLSRNIEGIFQSMKEIDSKKVVLPRSSLQQN